MEVGFTAGCETTAQVCTLKQKRKRLEVETELFGYAGSRHPLELYEDVALGAYCPVARLGEHVGETVVTCGLVWNNAHITRSPASR